MIKKRVFLYFVLLFGYFLFLCRSLIILDPDLGWHIQMGKLILHSGIPHTDPFSYTMASYPFVDHEWLTNVSMYVLYSKIGMVGLALLFPLIGVLSLVISSRFLRSTEAKLFFLLASTICAGFTGVRTQLITWLFFSVLLFLLFHEKKWIKYRYFIPLLFLVWVNLHGGFAIGVVILCCSFIIKSIEKRTIQKPDFLVLLLSIAATFINPYGYRIWWEVYMQMSDQTLRWTISEWMPAIYDPIGITLLFFISLYVTFEYLYWRKYKPDELIISICLLFAGISSVRHIPLWVITAVPLLLQGYRCIKNQASRHVHGLTRFYILQRYFIGLILLIALIQSAFFLQSLQQNSKQAIYPKKAVEFLHTFHSPGNVFSIYDWGGYLIWNLPEKKVFIDGRMPSWRWKSPGKHESGYAFEDYRNMGNGVLPVSKVIQKYAITVFLLPTETVKQHAQNTPWDMLLNTWNMYLFPANRKRFISIPDEIEKAGFKKVYSDSTATVWMKK